VEQGKKAYLTIYAILSVLISIVVVFCNNKVHSGLFMKSVGVVCASGLGFIGFLVADFIRKLAVPDIIFTTGGFFGLLKQRLFWMCGPQLIGIAIGAAIGAYLVLDIDGAQQATRPRVQLIEPMAKRDAPTTDSTEESQSQIEDDIDAQVGMLSYPSPLIKKIGEWALIGPVHGRYTPYFRAITNDCVESDSRMGCNLLVFDYVDHAETPTICIAVGVMSSIEEVVSNYTGVLMYHILVDGQPVGRIRFEAAVSPQRARILLEQAECADITNVYLHMLKGNRVSFIGDRGDHFDFDINGLSGLERQL
jgi:hypothetical protein